MICLRKKRLASAIILGAIVLGGAAWWAIMDLTDRSSYPIVVRNSGGITIREIEVYGPKGFKKNIAQLAPGEEYSLGRIRIVEAETVTFKAVFDNGIDTRIAHATLDVSPNGAASAPVKWWGTAAPAKSLRGRELLFNLSDQPFRSEIEVRDTSWTEFRNRLKKRLGLS